MRLKYFLLLFHLLVFCINGFSQNKKGEISVVVMDSILQTPIKGASLELITLPDSLHYQSAISDETGQFTFSNLPIGKYSLRYGFGRQSDQTAISIDSVSNRHSIVINESNLSKTLPSVSVKFKKPIITLVDDKLIFNIENASGVEGNSTFDILAQVPGVLVNGSEENIILNGQTNITVLIDDRKRTLTLAQTIQLLKTIPASNLKQIEIINSKSAKYDASGSGGVINIVTRRRLANGYNLQINNTTSIDRYVSNSSNLFLNYRGGKITVFSSLGYAKNNGYGSSSSNSNYFVGQANRGLLSSSENRNTTGSPYGDVNVDYAINAKHTIGVSTSVFFNDESVQSTKNTINNANASKTTNIKKGKYAENLNSYDLIYNGKMDTLGSKIKVDIGLIQGFSRKKVEFINEYAILQGITPRSEEIFAKFPLMGHQSLIQADIDKIIKPGRTLSFGLKYTAAVINNNANYDTLTNSGIHSDSGKTQNLRYKEEITSAYISYSHRFSKKVTGMVGIRYERTSMKNLYLDLNEHFYRTFNDFFPSFSLSVNKEKLKYSFNFNRSISRPYYGYINTYNTFIDGFSYQKGNPTLAPGYVYNAGFTGLYKNTLQLSIGYSYADKMVTLYRRQIPDSTLTMIRPENALTYSSVYANSSFYFSVLNSKLEGQLKISGFIYKNKLSTFFYKPEDLRLMGRYTIFSSESFKISKKTLLEFSASYYGKNKGNQFLSKSMFQANLGVRSKFFNDRLTTALTVNDLFNTMKQNTYLFYDGYNSYSNRTYNSRRIKFSLLYNLGKLKETFQKNNGEKKERERFKENQ